MTPAVHAISVLLPVLYLFALMLYGMELGGPRAPHPSRLRVLVGVLVLILHGGWMLLLARELGHLPVAGPWTACSALALAILVVYLPIEWATGTATTGVFVLGFTFVLQLIASCFGQEFVPSSAARSPFFAVHVTTATFAVASLLLSGFYGGLYLLLLRQIRNKQFGLLFQRLPDLESLSRLNRGAATVGFVLLTAGVNLGIWWAHAGAVERFDYLDPKVFPVLVLWLVFGIIGASRWVRILTGRHAAMVAVTATACLIVAVIITFLPLGSIHQF